MRKFFIIAISLFAAGAALAGGRHYHSCYRGGCYRGSYYRGGGCGYGYGCHGRSPYGYHGGCYGYRGCHHHGYDRGWWGRGGRNFWPGFVGGVVGGVIANAVTAPAAVYAAPATTVIPQQQVIIERPAPVVIERPAPVVIERPAPVVIQQPAPVVLQSSYRGSFYTTPLQQEYEPARTEYVRDAATGRYIRVVIPGRWVAR